jgi:integrase
VVLRATGARPGEIAKAAAADFRAGIGAIYYHSNDSRLADEGTHKTGSKGKDRCILLEGEALEIVRGLAAKHVTGPLFRTGRGAGWDKDIIVHRFTKIREKLGVKHLTAYSYRHQFATDWLKQGRSVDVLAELLGNTPDVIRKHYKHLLSDTDNLRQHLKEFLASRDTGTQVDLDDGAPASAVRKP